MKVSEERLSHIVGAAGLEPCDWDEVWEGLMVGEVVAMAKELLALRKLTGRTMPRHEFSQMVNELRDVPAVQSRREKIVRILHAFNINPDKPE